MTRKKGLRKQNLEKKRLAKQRELAELFAGENYAWISPLAVRIGQESHAIARFLAEAVAKLATTQTDLTLLLTARWALARNLAKVISPKAEDLLSKFEKTFVTVERALGMMSSEILSDAKVTSELIAPVIDMLASAVAENPRLVVLLNNPDLLKDSFGDLGEWTAALFTVIPALSSKASETLPELREIFFAALYEMPESDRMALYTLAEEILNQVFKELVFPRLEKILSGDARGKVLAPILLGAAKTIPGESCLNALLSIACTAQDELSSGRIIAIAIQELGGLYVKVSQVIAELCPPSLARELRANQDSAGGLFPGIEKSWRYLCDALHDEALKDWTPFLKVPEKPVNHFASASVGALYELELTTEGKQKFGAEVILVKLQRPGLPDLLKKQCNHLLELCNEAESLIRSENHLGGAMQAELVGIISAIRRAVLNYYKQSSAELDFTFEEKNANRVREALEGRHPIRIPRYYFTSKNLVLMERMSGKKVTRIVQTKYLERREIADTIARAYLGLLFNQGVVWADPHPGNILFDDVTNQVSMIDLNPCFVWDRKLREEFKHLLYRLILRDTVGVHHTLLELCENREALQNNKAFDDLTKFLNAPIATGSITRFVGEFIRTLSENSIDLRVEVQAALRGLSQVALTTAAVSIRNSFGLLLREHFGMRDILGAVWQVGVMRTLRVITGFLFDFIRHRPELDVGPVLDERDIRALYNRTRELARAGVCDIAFERSSPEDSVNLKMSSDGSHLLITSDLHIEVLEKTRPATVRYVIELPLRKWLKDRQEFVKLSSIARNFCIVECLEQLRRHSLDDYWRIVEAWNKPLMGRTVNETKLIGDVKVAARKLFALRFSNIWDTPYTSLSSIDRATWKFLMIAESWREEAEQSYITSMRRKFGNAVLATLAFGTFYRLKMLLYEAVLWSLRKRAGSRKFAMHLLPMTTHRLEEIILFGLSRVQPAGSHHHRR